MIKGCRTFESKTISRFFSSALTNLTLSSWVMHHSLTLTSSEGSITKGCEWEYYPFNNLHVQDSRGLKISIRIANSLRASISSQFYD